MTHSRLLNELTEKKAVSVSELSEKLSTSAAQVITFFESKLQDDGSYGPDNKDIACYFKSPMMFIAANKSQKALAILDYIKRNFMTDEGDFLTAPNYKSINPAYGDYWSYVNGWIIRAANQLGISDIAQIGNKYFSHFNIGNGKFLTNKISNNSEMIDVLTVAHHGLINLEMENLDTAISAGNFLCDMIHLQHDLKNGFYLRANKEGKLQTDFPSNHKAFYFISTHEPAQLHFMIGYPSAYLALLYQKTQNVKFLQAAKEYFNFSLSCNEDLYKNDFSHKIAWAAAILYECTKDNSYLVIIDRITNYFIDKQKNGIWFADDPDTSYDQSAELACWFLDIIKHIKNQEKVLDNEKFQPNGIESYSIEITSKRGQNSGIENQSKEQANSNPNFINSIRRSI